MGVLNFKDLPEKYATKIRQKCTTRYIKVEYTAAFMLVYYSKFIMYRKNSCRIIIPNINVGEKYRRGTEEGCKKNVHILKTASIIN